MRKLRVLLVDDEIMIREGFKKLFDWETHGCTVAGEAADGMEALAKIYLQLVNNLEQTKALGLEVVYYGKVSEL